MECEKCEGFCAEERGKRKRGDRGKKKEGRLEHEVVREGRK